MTKALSSEKPATPKNLEMDENNHLILKGPDWKPPTPVVSIFFAAKIIMRRKDKTSPKE